VNEIQRRFDELCKLGGGQRGGPTRGRVQALLLDGGQRLNRLAFDETAQALALDPSANPWHVMFAVGLGWGHLAILNDAFVNAAVEYLGAGDPLALDRASDYHNERGPEPLRASLASAKTLFDNVRLPTNLPTTLSGIKSAQDRWLGKLIGPQRPRYIGSWNATAMFMVAAFAQPQLAATMQTNEFMLPPGGPIWAALRKLHQTHLLSRAPAGGDLDDGDWEPGVLFENNALMAELIPGPHNLNMIDLHSGLYLLGTNHPQADSWIQ
jgi:hypothetical protein